MITKYNHQSTTILHWISVSSVSLRGMRPCQWRWLDLQVRFQRSSAHLPVSDSGVAELDA
jgi:hypothetical protein